MIEPAQPHVIVRQYFGRAQDDAVARYAADASELAGQGYLPVSQSWAYGQWPTLLIVLSVILCIFIVGFLLVALMLISKPDGTLAVTYVLQGTHWSIREET